MKGQATVEVALGSLVFVTVLIFGISFSEVTFLSMKVHEAATAALWDTTARDLHEHATRFGPRDRAIDQAGPRAESLYGSFDGRESHRGGDPMQQVFVNGENLSVRCTPDRVIGTSIARTPVFPGGEGGMRCDARAELAFSRIHAFAEGSGGFFQVPHLERRSIPICALGRAEAGQCRRGGYALLLDDWGLSGPDETQSCSLGRCKNDAYYDLVRDLYRKAQRGVPQTAEPFARAVVGATPGQSPRTFRFSFWDKKGDPAFQQGLDMDPASWMTNVREGSRNIRYHNRGTRFLGRKNPR